MSKSKITFKLNLPINETMCFEDEYEPGLKLSAKNKQTLKDQGAEFIYLLCEETGELIGETYFIPVDKLKEKIKGLSKWKNCNAIYVYSTTILSKYQGKGYGSELKKYFLNRIRDKFNFILGHAKEGASWKLNQNFSAILIKKEQNWQGTGTPYNFYKIEI